MAEMNKIDESQRIDTDARGNLQYRSASESGHVEVVLPALPGSPNGEERLLARDFGPTVAGKIESAMSKQGYLKSGPQQNGPQVFQHYLAVARGANLLASDTLKRAETLAKEFAAESEQAEFFKQVVRPWLHGLTPEKRDT